jgi:sec-independent protein translocase protein TatA
MPNIGPLEIAVVLIIVLIIFGPKRLPELGQSMGRGIREFKNSISGDKDKDEPEEKRRELQASERDGTDAAKNSTESVEGEVVTENKA